MLGASWPRTGVHLSPEGKLREWEEVPTRGIDAPAGSGDCCEERERREGGRQQGGDPELGGGTFQAEGVGRAVWAQAGEEGTHLTCGP